MKSLDLPPPKIHPGLPKIWEIPTKKDPEISTEISGSFLGGLSCFYKRSEEMVLKKIRRNGFYKRSEEIKPPNINI